MSTVTRKTKELLWKALQIESLFQRQSPKMQTTKTMSTIICNVSDESLELPYRAICRAYVENGMMNK